MNDIWFIRVGDYIGFWPGIAALAFAYGLGMTMAFLNYRSWVKRGLYAVGLTASVVVLWNVLELLVLA